MTQQNQDFSKVWKQSFSSKGDAVENSTVTVETSSGEPIMTSETLSSGSTVKRPNRMSPKTRSLFLVLGGVVTGLLLLLIGLAAFTYQQVKTVQAEAQAAVTQGRAVYTAFKTQNLPEAKAQLAGIESHRSAAEQAFQRLSFYRYVPVASTYYQDGEAGFAAAAAGIRAGEKFFAAIEPHADLLGFTGQETYFGTTEDRIGMVLTTLSQIAPQLDSIAGEIAVVKQNMDTINPQDYPEELRGYQIRSLLEQAKVGVDAAEVALNEARPALERLPAIAGAEGRRKYLVIFQNDNELRPTGGFLTAYAVVNVENGKVSPEKSGDIYELDQKFRNKPAIPAILGKYLTTESTWNLRDMNIDPNFETSMQTFAQYYEQLPGEAKDIDGIIAVDTELLKKIVDVIGPIEVPGYGTFSTQTLPICDCAQIIYALSEIIDRPTPYIRQNRKGILAPMMQSLIQKVYASPRDTWPNLAAIAWEGVQGRHVQMYFFDAQDQAGAKAVNAAGIIPALPKQGDYLSIIDANLAGAKSNLFIDMSSTTKVLAIENGRARKEVEVTYRNTHPPSNCNLEAGELCLNGLLNDWTRWYVPKGVTVEDAVGFKNGYTIDTTNPDYDVIEGFFTVSPMGTTKIRMTYSVPYALTDRYELTMQKQGGLDMIKTQVVTPWGSEEVDLKSDRTFRFSW